MTASRLRVAVSPLRRDPRRRSIETLPSVDAAVASLRPEEPLHCLRPAAITAAARSFVEAFDGRTLYAVKCNPEPRVLSALWRGGVKAFDCASPAEIALVRQVLPEATIHYMHPVKARSAIRDAWLQHGVRDFAIDSEAELEKILAEIGDDTSELGLIVRIALPKGKAALDLSGKFGIDTDEAPALLRRARAVAVRLGISFHVGSQCSDPVMWRSAIARAADLVVASGVKLDILDVGGGFPVAYPGADLPPLAAFMAEIDAGVAALRQRLGQCGPDEVWAEPGRALVAQGASVVVQVQARKGDSLYINDGVYGSLADAGALAWRFPLRLLRQNGTPSDAPARAFTLFGPTCDSLDRMDGGFSLPDDVAEGDWIEVGQLGAYGATLRTAFNGFDRGQLVEVADPPLLRTPGYAVA